MKNKENGRSMVEMLGVLAIIGVLSAGALAGFNTAMKKHKLNEHLDALNTIFQSAYELSQQLPEDTGWKQYSEVLYKSKGFPKHFKYSAGDTILDSFNNRFYFYRTSGVTWGFNYTIENSEFSKQICHNLVTFAIQNSSILSGIERSANYNEEGNYSTTSLYGDHSCQQNRLCLKDITLSDIDSFCSLDMGESTNNKYLFWILWK
ncbi:MAG TPA: hypothetical protein DIC64_04945 [Alphaproteobacteria bacterium]|nr:hypothetical protein [Alphaproteobacteria bacterium]